ncbi:S-layer homology domain-containing protein [Sporosarcina sp. Te-1]|uniref:S-layer homology domain-containing protein n=1 Tax=Sporosarcina sp. Te-1 TaxID=2818390 RepID=UPI001A9F7375|nr:S-layer homology domain-containing protein [Sporosarcina sp. Te-1]QTD41098.1 S-layer homology domain-containing protein [Sporosarcina sp. Te-1]
MKKIVSLTLLTLLICSSLFMRVAEASDIKGHQMEAELNYWIQKGVIKPDAKGNYNPNKAVTRGEFASYLSRALNLPVSTKYTFKDLKANTNLTIEIQNAAGAGILSGYPDGTFKPNDKITRQQMAGMIYKAFRYMDLPVQTIDMKFKDQAKISPNFRNAVSAAVNLNIIRGDHQKDGIYFKPQNSATIAHAAAFLFRMNAAAEVLKPDTPSEPGAPGKPEVPDVDPEVYKVSSISNGQVVPTVALYKTYEDALAVYNASSSIKAIQKNNKIIKMKSGRAFGAQNSKQLTSLYSDKTLRSEVTYIQKGREMKYIGSGPDYVIVEVAGSSYYAKQNEVDLVPSELVTGYDYYVVDNSGILTHYTYDNLSKSYGTYSIGPVPASMSAGKYTSLDGVHFTNVSSKKVITHYPYFQFQSVRQPSTYTGEELDRYIAEILRERESSGHARYKDLSTKSKLIGLGSYLKEAEQTYHVNAMFVLAAAIHESDYGISANAQTKNNLFGIKVFDSTPEAGEVYASPKNSVNAFITRYINLNYANPLGAHANGAVPGNKAVGFNVKYASDPNWGSKIAGHMWRIDKFLGGRDYKQVQLGRITYDGSTGVNVRTSPDASSAKSFTYKPKNPGYEAAFGYPLVIVDETTGSDGYVWYKVISDLNPPSDFGWIRSDLVTKINE